ncbi:response regulator transcription factor [Ornithinimicrobium ciconiae]|uniref:Response regulator transcription factor n=2 Tax=Ornithinimicrobium ciconiae TaxID=2594265 RepID=A0A516GF93_9MICO|nr:response regulator transcription factor [Ornithinimicrobium ciconiae]
MELLLPHLTHLVMATVRPTEAESMPTVTGREAAVLRHVALGLTNRQIGRDLGISEATVRKHLEHSYQKLGVSSRAGAMTVLTRRTNTA